VKSRQTSFHHPLVGRLFLKKHAEDHTWNHISAADWNETAVEKGRKDGIAEGLSAEGWSTSWSGWEFYETPSHTGSHLLCILSHRMRSPRGTNKLAPQAGSRPIVSHGHYMRRSVARRRWVSLFDPRTTCHMCPPFTSSMGDIPPGGRSAIRQLLHTLREQVTSIMFVGSVLTLTTSTNAPISQHKPSYLTLEEVRD